MSNKNFFFKFRELFSFIAPKRKKQFYYLILFTIFASFSEAISIGAVVPFIGALTNPESVYQLEYLSSFVTFFNIQSSDELITPLVFVFIIFSIIAGLSRLYILRYGISFSNLVGIDLGNKTFSNSINHTYEQFIGGNSSKSLSDITHKVSSATGVLVSIVNLVTAVPIFIAILITSIFMEPIGSLSMMTFFGVAYFFVSYKVRKKLRKNSILIANNQDKQVKILQESFGLIRDIILNKSHDYYIRKHGKALTHLRLATGSNSFINQFPRFIMETIGIVMLSVFILFMHNNSKNINDVLPIVALLAIAAQRLLPLMQIIYGNLSSILGNYQSLDDVIFSLKQNSSSDKNVRSEQRALLNFNKGVELRNVSFRYKDTSKDVINHLNLYIDKGMMVGLVGETGCGKSTISDILMGFLSPSEGEVLVDGRIIDDSNIALWRSCISHVPQDIYLEDSSIAENIAIGDSKDRIDYSSVREVIFMARLQSVVENSKSGLDTIVGERGVALSGGQKQRIGIARALYRSPKILFLDEATSALDHKIEREVMDVINQLKRDMAVVIIAHRITTLSKCDLVIELDKGKIKFSGDYEKFVKYRVENI